MTHPGTNNNPHNRYATMNLSNGELPRRVLAPQTLRARCCKCGITTHERHDPYLTCKGCGQTRRL